MHEHGLGRRHCVLTGEKFRRWNPPCNVAFFGQFACVICDKLLLLDSNDFGGILIRILLLIDHESTFLLHPFENLIEVTIVSISSLEIVEITRKELDAVFVFK